MEREGGRKPIEHHSFHTPKAVGFERLFLQVQRVHLQVGSPLTSQTGVEQKENGTHPHAVIQKQVARTLLIRFARFAR